MAIRNDRSSGASRASTADVPAVDALLPVIGPAMARRLRILRTFAQQDETILLTGPTGSGKSRLARWCHEQSSRRGQRFESLHLSSITENLQMAELFGWKKGAFTDAVTDNPGALGRAQGGTLFIDEVDKLSLRAQVGLLQLLEDKVYRRLGDAGSEQPADVRFIIGTNADLVAHVQQGLFRDDLYYRIFVLPFRVPALKDRPDELAQWAIFMLRRCHRQHSRHGAVTLTGPAAQELLSHDWPGNLRQLDNVMRRAYVMRLAASDHLEHDLTIDVEHIRFALDEETARRPAVWDVLQRAADDFVSEAQRHAERGTRLALDLTGAFKGLVLRCAVARLGSKDDAFRLFGEAATVRSRNHHKVLKRELELVDRLDRVLRGGLGSPDSGPR